ncbi:MAG: hypothetical protein Kow0067_08960 [Coriobacteriia bacterium]
MEGHGDQSAAGIGLDRRIVVLLVAVAVLLGLVVVKLVSDRAGGDAATRPDAVAAYDDARAGGMPVYVLFHSLTCEPCIEIDAVADKVVPEYEDRVAFVDAVTDEPDGQRLASRFDFQFIPTSFFISAEGDVVDSHTGVMTAAEMRARLDALLAE